MKPNPFNKYLGPEDRVQIAVTDYIRLQYPTAIIYHAPNEGRRTKFEQFKMKVLGTRPGFPDLLIFHKGEKLALELKKDKGAKPTDKQVEWLKVLGQHGFTATHAKGFDEAKKVIDEAFKTTTKQ